MLGDTALDSRKKRARGWELGRRLVQPQAGYLGKPPLFDVCAPDVAASYILLQLCPGIIRRRGLAHRCSAWRPWAAPVEALLPLWC